MTPRHIAIIMDGNRRWAKIKGLPVAEGYNSGIKNAKSVINECLKIGIKYLTLYAFSTENWKRPQEEIELIMLTIESMIQTHTKYFVDNNIKVSFIGDIKSLNNDIINAISKLENATIDNNLMYLKIAFNYGSRQEILDSVKSLIQNINTNLINIDGINEQILSSYLYDKTLPDPDLLIRPGGEKRISNFLLWQIAYTELYFCDILWPDFDIQNLHDAINDYERRSRRYGK